ncbi:MAG: hypothetical protein M0C28_25525 [Candidatus Moduliflexus flocculans]|nr:hypothetical protein [Candidatus Moduliflexus flocculans]
MLRSLSALLEEIQKERGPHGPLPRGRGLQGAAPVPDRKLGQGGGRVPASPGGVQPSGHRQGEGRGGPRLPAGYSRSRVPGERLASSRNLYSAGMTGLHSLYPMISEEERGTPYGSPISSIVLLEEGKDAAYLIGSIVPPILRADEPVPLVEAANLLNLLARMTVNLDSPAVSLTAGGSALGILRELSRPETGGSRSPGYL